MRAVGVPCSPSRARNPASAAAIRRQHAHTARLHSDTSAAATTTQPRAPSPLLPPSLSSSAAPSVPRLCHPHTIAHGGPASCTSARAAALRSRAPHPDPCCCSCCCARNFTTPLFARPLQRNPPPPTSAMAAEEPNHAWEYVKENAQPLKRGYKLSEVARLAAKPTHDLAQLSAVKRLVPWCACGGQWEVQTGGNVGSSTWWMSRGGGEAQGRNIPILHLVCRSQRLRGQDCSLRRQRPAG